MANQVAKFMDLTGQRFGKLTVLYLLEESRNQPNKKWMCRCDCGIEKAVDGYSLRKGAAKTCKGCIKNKDISGQTFHRWHVVSRSTEMGDWNCVCECGTEKVVSIYQLLRGKPKSCGCLSKEILIKRNKSFAKYGVEHQRLLNIWDTMKARCYRPNSKDFKNYGARGIKICDEWKNDFFAFYEWARGNGYEDHLTIDRINVNGNYEPSNCQWATTKQQGNNTRINRHITIGGETKTIAEWSEVAGISPKALRYRIEAEWREEELLVPVGVQKVYVTIGEETKCLSEWVRKYGVSISVAYSNYKKGFQGEEIFHSRKKEVIVEINGVTKTLSQWAKDTGLKYYTLHGRYRRGIKGEALIKPVGDKRHYFEQLTLF
ncbi:hypothetical protein V7139_19925 [Neobacillus drentensis]|uniref:hypothetical protein n=1 Tax=Neobacillus drentensis TaxID=220684 RepID=UPI0030034B18